MEKAACSVMPLSKGITKGLTLDEVQRKEEGDLARHALVVDPTNRMLYEFYQMRKTDRVGPRQGRRSST